MATTMQTGLPSTTISTKRFEMLGAQVSYYLPNRFTDGYGPNIPAFQRAIEEGHTLIITVDCGLQRMNQFVMRWRMAVM